MGNIIQLLHRRIFGIGYTGMDQLEAGWLLVILESGA